MFRKRKVKELREKSQRRKEQAMKKNEEEKKSNTSIKTPKQLQTFGKKSEHKISDDPEPEPPKLQIYQKNPDRENRSNLNAHESQYGVKSLKKSSYQPEK